MFRLFSTCAAMSAATSGLASKFAPIVPTGMRSSRTSQPVGERPARDLPLERLERGGRLELARDRRQARLVEAEPVERALVQLLRGGLHVSRVRGEHVRRAFLEQRGRPCSAGSDRLVGQRRQRSCRRDRFSSPRARGSCFTLYTVERTNWAGRVPLRIRRGRGIRPDDASATCPRARCQPAEQPARIDVERRDEGDSQCPPHSLAAATAARAGLDGGRRLRPLLGAARARLRPRRAPPAPDARADRGRPAVALALRAAAARSSAARSRGSRPA